MGGDYAVPALNVRDANNPQEIVKRKGDRFDYNISSFAKWIGAFTELEFKKNRFSGVISLTTSYAGYNRSDYYELRNEDGSYPSSGLVTFYGFTVKGGLNYKLTAQQSIFVNGGFYTLPPHLVFVFQGRSIVINPDIINKKIEALEVGYLLRLPKLAINLNGYYTFWRDRPVRGVCASGPEIVFFTTAMDALHRGIEVDASYNIFHNLNIEGLISVGDWTWQSAKTVICFDDDTNLPMDTVEYDAVGIKSE